MARWRWVVIVVVLVLATAGLAVLVPGSGAVLHVAVDGDDGHDGSAEAPLRTIQLAVEQLGPRGGTVVLGDGRYTDQRVVVTDSVGLTLRPAAGARPVLDGSGLQAAEGPSGVIEVRGGGPVTVQGLEITGYRGHGMGSTPAGILVTGSVAGVTVRDSLVRGISAADPQDGGAAHGIAVYGDRAEQSVRDVVLEDNEVTGLTLGSGAAVLLSGNVSDWVVRRNHVHAVDGTGIDVQGFGPTLTGPDRYRWINRPRRGGVEDNEVRTVTAAQNPAYGPEGCLCAPGISVDGGFDVAVRGNTVVRADVGVRLGAADPAGTTDEVDIVDNTVTGSRRAGLVLGAGDQGGRVAQARVADNELIDNSADPDAAEVVLRTGLSGSRLVGNDITSTATNPVLVRGVVPMPSLSRNRYVAVEPRWLLGETELRDLQAWQQATGQDGLSLVALP